MALLPDRIFNVRIKLRNDSHINWNKKAETFVPMDGEIVIYDVDDSHDFQMIKIGDGITTLGKLPFINDSYNKQQIDNFIQQLRKAISDTNDRISKLARVAHTGNVADLVQNENDYLTLECNFQNK